MVGVAFICCTFVAKIKCHVIYNIECMEKFTGLLLGWNLICSWIKSLI